MTTAPRWWSEPVPPRGAITSEGILRQLGTPTVDPLTVFVRESAQNSWDARVSDTVEYELAVMTFPEDFARGWADLLRSPAEFSALPVGAAFAGGGLRILAVSDRGSRGLGGPTRADGAPPEIHDWISFVLNIGEPRDTPGGGGTYGYGKAVYFKMSRVRTIVVYTRTAAEGGGFTTRLIGIALGPSYTANGLSYTGRYWWGLPGKDHVEPVVDDAAEALAERLGLPGFGDRETGTTIVVLDPDFGEIEDDAAAAVQLADEIAWQLWPIMLADRATRLAPSVTVAGVDVPVPDPVSTYPLSMFVKAYRGLDSDDAETLECYRPYRRVGTLSLVRSFVVPCATDTSRAAVSAGVPRDPYHVCLMRKPELVVRYVAGQPPFVAEFAYAGVFRADDALDDVFANAEPPTHDDWVAEHLTGNDARFVRAAKRRIKERLTEYTRPAEAKAAASELPLGGLSNFLGTLIAVAGGEGAALPLPGGTGFGGTGSSGGGSGGGGGGAGGGGGGSRGRAVRTDGDPEWVVRDGETVLLQRIVVAAGARLRCDLAVRTADGTRETEAPLGAAWPETVGWEFADGSFVPGPEADVPAGVTSGAVLVRPPDDAVIDIDVRQLSGTGS